MGILHKPLQPRLQKISQAEAALKRWFLKHRAALPWRAGNPYAFRDPYAVWISEVMLQQTQVEAVKQHFMRWMRDYPGIRALASAGEEAVLLHWQGLGYYSRAKNIHRTAQILLQRYNAAFPETREEIEALPGIGKYTAGAIQSFARHKAEAILDGNLIRIFSRLHTWNFLPDSKRNSNVYWNEARAWCAGTESFITNEALMELGRTVCKAKNPGCDSCPLSPICTAYAEKSTGAYPPKKKSVQKSWTGVVAVIESADGKILAVNGAPPFLKDQRTLPLFEFSKAHAKGLPGAIETFIPAENVSHYEWVGSFRHSITIHRMECAVLYIRSKKRADNLREWIPAKSTATTFANSLSIKALKIAGFAH